MNSLTLHSYVIATKVCPSAPRGAEGPVNEILGYVLWGVGILFFVGIVVGIGGLVAGRVFGMPHATKAALVGLVIVFLAGIGYLTLPGMLDSLLGSGCI